MCRDADAARMLSNTAMPSSPPAPSSAQISAPASEAERTEQRLTELEIKSAFTEDLLDHLNETIVAQQRQIDLLVRELSALRQQQTDSQPTAFRSLRDELPPHY